MDYNYGMITELFVNNGFEKFSSGYEEYLEAKRIQEEKEKENDKKKEESKQNNKDILKKKKEEQERINKENCIIKYPRYCNNTCVKAKMLEQKVCTAKKSKKDEIRNELDEKIRKIDESSRDRFYKLDKMTEVRNEVDKISNEVDVEYKTTYNKWLKKWNTKTESLDLVDLKKYYDDLCYSYISKYSKPIDCEYQYLDCNKDCKSELKIITKSGVDGKKCPTKKFLKCPEGEGKCPNKPIDCEEGYSECKFINGKCMKQNQISNYPKYGGKSCVNKEYIQCKDGEGFCPTDCKGSWTKCDSSCKKYFKVEIQEKNGGKCDYKEGDIKECKPKEGDCPDDINCVGIWSKCNSSCNQIYKITSEKSGKGEECRFENNYKRKCEKGKDYCIDTKLLRNYTFNTDNGLKIATDYSLNKVFSRIVGENIIIKDGSVQFIDDSIKTKPYIDLGDRVISGLDLITIEMWVSTDKDNIEDSTILYFGNISEEDNINNSISIHRNEENGKLSLTILNKNDIYKYDTKIDFNSLDKSYIVCTLDNVINSCKLYVNGNLEIEGKMIYESLSQYVTKEIHALQIKTYTEKEFLDV